ncbi:hypothetical protein GJAV_G00242070 [Gymnothorax javanicus]|nr:hypothetical protein GJAV_G00242070 [Gymnothorax javanicus]
MKKLSSFTVHRPTERCGHVLCGWIAGHESEYMETLPEAEVLESITKLIRRFTGDPTITPIRMVRSQWFHDPYTCGSYSCLNKGCSELDIKTLAEPLPLNGSRTKPLQVLFAGEATHSSFFSTVHGALLSGWREGDRIISHYSHSSKLCCTLVPWSYGKRTETDEIESEKCGLNPVFQESLNIRPHLLVLNKWDLGDPSSKQRVLKQLEKSGVENVLFTDCRRQTDENVKKIVPMVTQLIENSPRYHREEDMHYCLMVIGVPNVGKSSLINALRRTKLKKGKASRVGGEPGITKAVLSKIQVCERPALFLVDTPGVFPPKVENVETGMKLALCGTILDHLVGEDVISDYLLYSLNRLGKFSYVDQYDLGEPSDDIQHVLKRIAVKLGKTQRVKAITGVGDITIKMPNYSAAAYHFIRAFRRGDLGRVMLD